MHQGGSEEDAASRVLSQAEADRCCAASEPDDSSSSPSRIAFVATLGAILSPVPAWLPAPESHGTISGASVLIPITHVPKHLLLSVFLV